jgi:hypothetical protein
MRAPTGQKSSRAFAEWIRKTISFLVFELASGGKWDSQLQMIAVDLSVRGTLQVDRSGTDAVNGDRKGTTLSAKSAVTHTWIIPLHQNGHISS